MNKTHKHSNDAVTAYRQFPAGSSVGVFYLPGHRNIFAGWALPIIEQTCADVDIGLTHFTYWGWDGSSHPDIPEKGERYANHWLTQAIELFDATTTGPQILLGYSMGGMLALGLAAARPERVSGIVGLACGFGNEFANVIPEKYGELAIADLSKNVRIPITHSADRTYDFPEKLSLKMPMQFRNSSQDEWVSPQTARNIMAACPGAKSAQSLKEEKSHRFELPEDREWLKTTLASLKL